MSKAKSTKRATKPKAKTTARKPAPARPRTTSRLTPEEESEVTTFGERFLQRAATEAPASTDDVDDRVLIWVRTASLPMLILSDGNGGMVAHRSWSSANGYHIGPPYPIDDVNRPEDPATLWHAKIDLEAPAPDFDLLTQMAGEQEAARAAPKDEFEVAALATQQEGRTLGTALANVGHRYMRSAMAGRMDLVGLDGVTTRIAVTVGDAWAFVHELELAAGKTSRPPAHATSHDVAITSFSITEDSDEPVRCSEPGCRRSYVGEKLPGWHLFVSSTTGLPVAHCHSHAKIGERMLAAQVSAIAKGRPAGVERAEELHREHRRDNDIKSPTYGDHLAELDDAPARAFNETMAAIDKAIDRSGEPPIDETKSIGGPIAAPVEPTKAKRGSKKKPATEETFPFGCAEKVNGCLTTYMAPMRDADVLGGVPNPPDGWWVYENAEGGERAAYCTSHRTIGERRTAADNPKTLNSLTGTPVDDFIPDLDVAPSSSAPPPWEMLDMPAPAPAVEKAPWE